MPIALEPPPTQAATASGSRPVSSSTCSRASSPMTRWKSRDHQRERVRPGDRAEQVVGGVDVGDPVAHRLVDRVLERPRAGADRDDRRAEQLHPGDVERLPAGVLLAHVDHALEAEQRAGGRRRDAVLAGAGLGDDPGLAHPLGEQRLAERRC